VATKPGPTTRQEDGVMTTTKRFVGRLVPAASVAGALLLFPATSASAHPTSITQGRDAAFFNTFHTSGRVCDMEKDGNYTYVTIWNTEGGGATFFDDGGADGVCDNFYWQDHYGTPSTWQMCEERPLRDPCTAPKAV
jgi:hypothetical protein